MLWLEDISLVENQIKLSPCIGAFGIEAAPVSLHDTYTLTKQLTLRGVCAAEKRRSVPPGSRSLTEWKGRKNQPCC